MVLRFGSCEKAMAYKLKYHPDVKRSDLPKIDARNRDMIKRAIKERLATQPESYGKPLQRTLKGYWKLRVGDYRVIFKVSSDDILIHRFAPTRLELRRRLPRLNRKPKAFNGAGTDYNEYAIKVAESVGLNSPQLAALR